MSVYRRVLRGADNTHRHWVALEEEKCIGENFHMLRNFCERRGLSLSRHGHSLMSENKFYQVFMFAVEEDAEVFRAQFGGERLHPSQKGRGTHWSQWKKIPENIDAGPSPNKYGASLNAGGQSCPPPSAKCNLPPDPIATPEALGWVQSNLRPPE